MLAPLFTVTLVSAEPEVQWVALRNINLLLQKRPEILQNEMRIFFCKYNDPPYIKIEKLDIMIRLAGEKNVDTLLSELKECVSHEFPNEYTVSTQFRPVAGMLLRSTSTS